MKARVLWAVCALLDKWPRLDRDQDGRWYVGTTPVGCRLGLSERAMRAQR
jgi:hypothetical protein